MNPSERRNEIVNIIRERKRAYVDELADLLHISRETIRRDLTALEQLGKVRKFHGGATLPMVTGEGPFRERMGENVLAKVAIAGQAIQLVQPGETLFIDTGSTTLYFAERLGEKDNLTIVTNSAEIARITAEGHTSNQAFLLGGEFHADNRQTVGPITIEQIRAFRAHHAVLTIGALDGRTGIMDFNINEARIAQAMIRQAESITILADASKFGRIASFKVCDLDRVTTLVCDRLPDEPLAHQLDEAGVRVISCS